ncbi:MAG: hypothetical protein J1F42_03070 [Lachnospiraceae bacterium]|nr:hypothetical protein [Lachnospiraceae bacterium]
MRRLRIGIFLSFVVMLTACASDVNSPEDTELSQLEDYVFEPDRDDNTADSSETAQAEDKAEDMTDAAQPNETSEDLTETSQPDELAKDSTESAENNESDEPDTIYFKPSNTYQDILDNAYEVIIHRGADFVEADEIFSSIGIWESGLGRNTEEALAGIGYTFYDVDGNGIEELIIMDTDEDSDIWDNRILTMYSLLDGKPVLVIDGWARNRYYLLNDGTFYNEGSGGAAYTIFATYRMAADGVNIEVIDYYFSDYRDDSFKEYWLAEGNWGWFHNTTGVHKKDESEWMEFENEDVPWEMMENYIAQVKQLDLTFFETMRP